MSNSRLDHLDFFTLHEDGHLETLSPAMLSAMSSGSSTDFFMGTPQVNPNSILTANKHGQKQLLPTPKSSPGGFPSPLSSPQSATQTQSPVVQQLTEAQKRALASVQEAQAERGQSEMNQHGIDTSQMSINELRNLAIQMQSVDASTASELRRQMHIQCEQKRRAQIKDGFEELKNELPGYQNKKMSKSLVLNKTLDFVRRLKQEREVLLMEMERLRLETEAYRAAALQMSQSPADSR